MNSNGYTRARRQRQAKQYRRLRIEILERDGWRCQCCGRREQLEVHHRLFRSQSGTDSEQNLISLCSECHRAIHTRILSGQDR